MGGLTADMHLPIYGPFPPRKYWRFPAVLPIGFLQKKGITGISGIRALTLLWRSVFRAPETASRLVLLYRCSSLPSHLLLRSEVCTITCRVRFGLLDGRTPTPSFGRSLYQRLAAPRDNQYSCASSLICRGRHRLNHPLLYILNQLRAGMLCV
jgi:hypothetical protein